MGINGSRKAVKNLNAIKVINKTFLPDDYDEKSFNQPYYGLAIPSHEDFVNKYGYDATPVDRNLLLSSKDPKLRNDPNQLIFHRVKFTKEQWDFMLEQASDDMTMRLKEIYADMILREGEFKFRVGSVKYLGPGKPGNCGEPSCNHRIGTAYYLEPIDPTRKDLGEYPEYVGSTCITHIAGIDPKTALEIKKLETDAKGERDSVAEALERYGSFENYIQKTETDEKVTFLKSITDEELEEYNKRYNGYSTNRRMTRKKLDNRVQMAEKYLEHRLPLKETNQGNINSIYHALKWERSQKYHQETHRDEILKQEQRRAELAADIQKQQVQKQEKERKYKEFCEDFLKKNPNNNFISSLYSQISRGRSLTIRQEEALERTMKQKQGIFDGTVNKAEADKQMTKLQDVIAKVNELARTQNDPSLTGYANYLSNTLMPKLEKGIPLSEEREMEHFNKALRWLRPRRAVKK